MDYKILTEEERHDMLVEFHLAQERDHHSHMVNLERYNKILETTKDQRWLERIKQLKAETESRLVEVNSIIESTLSQLPYGDKLNASMVRIKAKQDQVGGKQNGS